MTHLVFFGYRFFHPTLTIHSPHTLQFLTSTQKRANQSAVSTGQMDSRSPVNWGLTRRSKADPFALQLARVVTDKPCSCWAVIAVGVQFAACPAYRANPGYSQNRSAPLTLWEMQGERARERKRQSERERETEKEGVDSPIACQTHTTPKICWPIPYNPAITFWQLALYHRYWPAITLLQDIWKSLDPFLFLFTTRIIAAKDPDTFTLAERAERPGVMI